MEELLSLKWNNHRSTFLHILGVLRDKQAYTDVTLACDGKFYSVHKLVLSTCSDYFCAMFDKTACKSPVIVLKDIKSEDLEALLDYMYLGEVNVRQSDLASLIKAAENLRIKGLAVPDDEPPKKGAVAAQSRVETSRRDGGSGSPPAKRKRRDEGEDGREDVRPSPSQQSGLHTPPPLPSRPKSPVSQRLSPSPLRTSQESHVTEDRDSRPLSSPAESSATSHVPSHQSSQQLPHQSSQSSLQPSQPLPEQQQQQQQQQQVSNQYRAEDTPTFVKVEMEEEDTSDMHRDSFNVSGDGYKEEDSGGDLGGDLSNDLPEFLQQAASGALAGTSTSYHHAFAGPSGFQPDVSGWQGDSQSLPGSFTGLGFQPSSQDNPPGIGAELLGNVCKVCGKLFNGRNWKQNLEYHFLTHTKEKPFKCPICPHSSALKYNLIRHIRNRHRDLLTPAFQNQQCDRDSTDEIQMVATQSNKLPAYREVELLLSRRSELFPSREVQVPRNTGIQRPLNRESHARQNLEIKAHSVLEVQGPPQREVHVPCSQEIHVGPNQERHMASGQEIHTPSSQGLGMTSSRETSMLQNQEINLSLNREIDMPMNQEGSINPSQEMNVHPGHDVDMLLNREAQVHSSQEVHILSEQEAQMSVNPGSQVHF